jgi:hypothetical protein
MGERSPLPPLAYSPIKGRKFPYLWLRFCSSALRYGLFGRTWVSDGRNDANCANVIPVESKMRDIVSIVGQRSWPYLDLWRLRLKVVASSPDIHASREQDILLDSARFLIPPHNSSCVILFSFGSSKILPQLRILSKHSSIN